MAWSELTGAAVQPWEAIAMVQMDRVRHNPKEHELPDMMPATNDNIKNIFRRMAARKPKKGMK